MSPPKIDGATKRGEQLDEAAASSKDTKMSSKLTVDDPILKKQTQRNKLQLQYVYAYVLKRIYACPETACTNSLTIQGLVQHIIETHNTVPKYIVQLEQYSEVEVNLPDLVHGKSYCTLVLFVSLSSETDCNVVSDRTTMPLMVMAAKINPCGLLSFSELQNGPPSPDMQLMYPGELLMIWICGHLQCISSLIKVQTTQNGTNEYAGNIHSVAENNFDPHVVFSRGNCLLVPANDVMQLTKNGKIPLKVQIQLSVQEE